MLGDDGGVRRGHLHLFYPPRQHLPCGRWGWTDHLGPSHHGRDGSRGRTIYVNKHQCSRPPYFLPLLEEGFFFMGSWEAEASASAIGVSAPPPVMVSGRAYCEVASPSPSWQQGRVDARPRRSKEGASSTSSCRLYWSIAGCIEKINDHSKNAENCA